MKARAWVLLIACLAMMCLASAVEYQDVTEGEWHEVSLANSTYHYIKYDLSKVPSGKDFVIIAKGLNVFSDPNIYISKLPDPEPTQDQFTYSCSSYGMDICELPKDRLANVEFLYIGMQCLKPELKDVGVDSKCSFKYQVYSQNITEIKLGEQNYVILSKLQKQSEIIQFYIPSAENFSEIKRIVISVEVANPYGITEATNMYYKKGQNKRVSSSDYQKKAYDLWGAGKGFIL